MIRFRAQKGFSILEVLISFVILVVGILGASILIIRSSQLNVKAYETERVAIVANTFVEKMRLNAANMNGYVNPVANPSSTQCASLDWTTWCKGEQLVDLDITDFSSQLNALKIRNTAWNVTLVDGSILGSPRNKRYKLLVTWDTVQGPESSSSGASTQPSASYYTYFITDSGAVKQP